MQLTQEQQLIINSTENQKQFIIGSLFLYFLLYNLLLMKIMGSHYWVSNGRFSNKKLRPKIGAEFLF